MHALRITEYSWFVGYVEKINDKEDILSGDDAAGIWFGSPIKDFMGHTLNECQCGSRDFDDDDYDYYNDQYWDDFSVNNLQGNWDENT